MAVLILDPLIERRVREARRREAANRWDEVWDGVLVIHPAPDNEHRQLVLGFAVGFVESAAGGRATQVLPGANVSDREDGWTENYRIPDVVVCLDGGPARDCDTHWSGGPDIAVEIVCPGEVPRQKLDFYAKIGTREVLLIERNPWAVELYQLAGGTLGLTGRSDPATPAALASGVLPLTFQLQPGTPRPTILVAQTATGHTWVV